MPPTRRRGCYSARSQPLWGRVSGWALLTGAHHGGGQHEGDLSASSGLADDPQRPASLLREAVGLGRGPVRCSGPLAWW